MGSLRLKSCIDRPHINQSLRGEVVNLSLTDSEMQEVLHSLQAGQWLATHHALPGVPLWPVGPAMAGRHFCKFLMMSLSWPTSVRKGEMGGEERRIRQESQKWEPTEILGAAGHGCCTGGRHCQLWGPLQGTGIGWAHDSMLALDLGRFLQASKREGEEASFY